MLKKLHLLKVSVKVAGFIWLLLAINVAKSQDLAGTKPVVNVRESGAQGDGEADDGPAIQRAVAKIAENRGGTLYFPAGSYRCGRNSINADGIKLNKISNVTIEFAPDAELVMDNLNPATGVGDQGHGVFVVGPAQNIRLNRVKIRWAKRPLRRSQGDGLRFFGFPAVGRAISGVVLADCRIENAPQTGAIFMGCANVRVLNLQVQSTLADGLHFNACRKVSVNGYRAFDTGDDGFAFVTYAPGVKMNLAKGPFSVPTLGRWSNTGSVATDIEVEGGSANGVRVSGALNVSLSNIRVKNKSAGIIIDSGKKDRPRVGWSYHASRGITIDGLTAENCDIGLMVINHNVPPAEGATWWRFDVAATNLHVETSRTFGICLTRCAGVKLNGLFLGGQELRRQGTQSYTDL